MELTGLKLPLVKPGDDFVTLILKSAGRIGGLKDGDVLVVASKVVGTAEGRLKELAGVKPSKKAKELAKSSGLPAGFVEVVLREADEVLGTNKGAILTIKNGVLCANAGADRSNAPPGFAVLMPSRPDAAAKKIGEEVYRRSGKRIGVIIADSNVKPLRIGTVGQAVGVSGISAVLDCRGDLDIYGRPLKITFRAIADQLATAAQVIMGEGAEQTPAVIIRGVKVAKSTVSPKISPEKDLYASLFK